LDQVQGALDRLAQRHSALRTRFRRFAGGRIEQFSVPGDVPSNEIVGSDSNPLSATEAETEKAGFIARPFDLLNGVSARYQLIAGNNGQLISTIVLHPIVCDEAALAVLRGDLIALA
ncbi:hypothetical protein LJD47_32245, partial [Escherichia coli]|nr:hypothetical protein [Escherichia coli]